MSHGASRESRLKPENGASLFTAMPCQERHIARAEPSAHGRHTPGQPVPVKAASRRSPGARSASLDRRRLVRHRVCQALMAEHRSEQHAKETELGSAPSTHCDDSLSEKENSDSCKVGPNQ